MSFTRDLPTPERVLAISAHPDDSELQAGATLAKWAADGCEVSILVCTDGSKGTWNPQADIAALVARRQAEQRSAASVLGATGEVGFCGWVDGELQSGLEHRMKVAEYIRRLRPNVVIGHDPWKRYRLHPDHRHAGLLTVEGIVAARDPHFFPELGVDHHRPDELLLFEADEPDHLETVGDFVMNKIASLEEHRSQHESTMFIDDDDDGSQAAAFRARIHDAATDFARLDTGAPAEAFKRIHEL